MPREIKGIDSSLHIRRKPLAFATDAVSYGIGIDLGLEVVVLSGVA
jgi:hypothetical protein